MLIFALVLLVAILALHLLHVHLGHTVGVDSHLLLTIIHVLCDSKVVLVTASFIAVRALTQHDDLILSFSVLPTTEDEQVRADSCGCVAEADGWGLTEVLTLLP